MTSYEEWEKSWLWISDPEIYTEVFRIFSHGDAAAREDLLWRVSDDGAFRFAVLCNDVFMWGSADAEEINTPEDVALLRQTYDDCHAIDPYNWIWSMLYCARKRQMRPQGAMYKHVDDQFVEFFSACGPERETGLGNPHRQDRHKQEKTDAQP